MGRRTFDVKPGDVLEVGGARLEVLPGPPGKGRVLRLVVEQDPDAGAAARRLPGAGGSGATPVHPPGGPRARARDKRANRRAGNSAG